MYKGRVLQLDTGLIVVPYKQTSGHTFDCVVVKGNRYYEVGCFNLSIFTEDLKKATLVNLVPTSPHPTSLKSPLLTVDKLMRKESMRLEELD
jgi:hypothetical protein